MSRLRRLSFILGCSLFALLGLGMSQLTAPNARAQAGTSTGSIQGTVLDPNGGSIAQAKVSITSKGTGAKTAPQITGTGAYNSGPLVPGEYLIRVEATGFKALEETVTVQVGNITQGTVTLEVGSEGTVVTVEGSAVSVNTEQATIQGVVTSDQIENLPINGRNFLDLAQLEPGVQIQDGGNFDPTKKGFSSISFGGRFGRTARVEVDGLDISDETVGTTTQNVPVNSIKEFQVSQSSLDLSTELTSSGTVNITTISGTNTLHSEGFFNYRSDGTSAAIGDPAAQFTRKQYGVNLGGPFWKDKLFGFGSWERTTQDLIAFASPIAPFDSLSSGFNAPFRDQEYLGRVDYNITNNVRAFFKFGYEQNLNAATFVPGTYQEFANVDFTPSYGGGVDLTHGSWTHSFRIGYLKFRNGITDAVTGSSIFNPAPGLALAIGNVSTACTVGGDLFCSGPNILAPQKTYQSNKQFKYDGTKSLSSHTVRFGVGVNRILGGGFASFFGIAPAVRAAFSTGVGSTEEFAASDPFGPGGASNPLNYPVHRIDVGNGEGCFTEIAEFGQDCGGQFDTRFQAYIGDSWRIRKNLTLLYGLRYNRDTGRSDSDLPAVKELNDFQSGLGNPVRQPDKNFGGTIGLAWDPWKDGKTAIRAGAGIYYENGVFNNILFDRPGRLQTGLFNQVQEVCTQQSPVTGVNGGITLPDQSFVDTIDGLYIPTQICGDQNAVGNVQTAIADLQKLYQQATVSAGAQANGAYFGASNTTANTGSMFAPNYRSPYSVQMNVGIQRELRPGTVISVDYIRNVGLHTLLGIDQNHQGDASILDTGVATSAISATNSSFGCGTGTDATSINCAILKGAKIGDYAGNGLTGGANATGNFPVGAGSVAFPGKNPDFGAVLLLEPIGRSVYNGLDVVLRSDLKSPVRFVRHLNAQVSYSLSRYDSEASDGDFINSALDFNNPSKFIGPNGLDRTHQFSAGVVMDLPAGIRANFITHYYTALPQTLTFFAPGNLEDIFQYDTTGDGQTGIAPVPGSKVGAFGRDINAGNLNAFLQTYSDKFGNQLTPAGQALVTAGLFTADQLTSLCAITPSLNPAPGCQDYDNLQLPTAPAGQVNNGNFFTFDLRLGWSIRPIKAWERFRIEPQAAFYNLFNHKNYNGPDNLISGVLDGSAGSVAGVGTTKSTRAPFETGLGSGVFAIGAPRSMEFGFKDTF
jgi:hypothetical protein